MIKDIHIAHITITIMAILASVLYSKLDINKNNEKLRTVTIPSRQKSHVFKNRESHGLATNNQLK